MPAARARLELSSWVDPLALEGLEGYSHCWVFYLFHANTDGLCMLDAGQAAPQQVGQVSFCFHVFKEGRRSRWKAVVSHG